MSDSDEGWKPGQRCAIDRREIVTIDKVTPTGIAKVGIRSFSKNGFERGRGDYRCPRLELLTPEIKAEMELRQRAILISSQFEKDVRQAEKWMREVLCIWSGRVPEAANVERAKRIMRALHDAWAPADAGAATEGGG